MKILNINANNGANLGDALIAFAIKKILSKQNVMVKQFELASLMPSIDPESKNLQLKRFFFLVKRKILILLGYKVEKKIQKEIKVSELIIIGGGQLLLPFFIDKLVIVGKLAQKHNKKIIFLGVGAEKIEDDSVLSQIINVVDNSYLRDSTSIEKLSKLGFNVHHQPVPDVVFAIQDYIYQSYKGNQDLLLSPCEYDRIRYYNQNCMTKEEYIDWWVAEVKKRKLKKVNFLVSVKKDYKICVEIGAKLRELGIQYKLYQPSNVFDYIIAINSHKEIISGRMHPLIVAECNQNTILNVQRRNEKLISYEKKYLSEKISTKEKSEIILSILQKHINYNE